MIHQRRQLWREDSPCAVLLVPDVPSLSYLTGELSVCHPSHLPQLVYKVETACFSWTVKQNLLI